MACDSPEDAHESLASFDDESPKELPTSPLGPAPPSPPPPPPLPASRIIEETDSIMTRKFKSAPADWLTSGYTLDDTVPPDFGEFKKEHYFFYGTLTDPHKISQILEKPVEQASLRQAQLVGYSCEMWGCYKALVDGPMGAIVEGVAYEVQSEEDEVRLAAYETNTYESVYCDIDLKAEDGSVKEIISGKTFRYAGDQQVLREKRFDRKLWIKNMDPMFRPR